MTFLPEGPPVVTDCNTAARELIYCLSTTTPTILRTVLYCTTCLMTMIMPKYRLKMRVDGHLIQQDFTLYVLTKSEKLE